MRKVDPSAYLPRLTGEGRCCEWCVSQHRTELCSLCGQLGFPCARRDGGSICRDCYNKAFVEPCARCGRVRAPTTRTEEGSALCWSCAPRTVRQCSNCGEFAVLTTGKRKQALCRRCYKLPARTCGVCGETAEIVVRARDGDPDRCRRCRIEPKHECALCGNERPAKALWPIGAVCGQCYRRFLSSPATCAQCGHVKVLIGRAESGPICGPCSGVARDYVCEGCGDAGQLVYRRRCARCSARLRASELMSTGGCVPEHLTPLLELLARTPRPDSTLRWMGRPYTAHILNRLSLIPDLTHERIDELACSAETSIPPFALDHVRHLLVASGVLPTRNDPLARVERWLANLIPSLPAHHSRLIHPYAQWSVLRRGRRRAKRGRYTGSSAAHGRQQINTAIGLLGWIDTQGHTLADLSQVQLDNWIDGDHSRSKLIAGFVKWIAEHHLVPRELRIHHRASPDPSNLPDADEHLDALRRLASDDNALPLETRAAGLLVLLYGLQLTRLQRITLDQLEDRGGQMYIVFADNPVLLASPVAAIVNELATRSASQNEPTTGDRYLFASRRRPGAPLSTSALGFHLNRAGIFAGIGRSGALAALAEDLPAPVIADLLGVHINTAVRWTRVVQRDWSHYLAARHST